MTPLAVPVFIQGKPRGAKPELPARVVGALRWDYEVGLMSMADVARKYSGIMHPATARRIMNRTSYPDVKSVRNTAAWRPK